jgi:alpha-N-arabinofuranosidase
MLLISLTLLISPRRIMNPHTITATVDVQLAAPAVQYSRNLFGQFIEHFHRQIYGGVWEPGSVLSDAKGYRLDVVDALRELSVPVVRWPGGCFVSGYHWIDGVGPNRVSTFDKAWRVDEPNEFGTDEFVDWARLIGAEPYICTNAGTGTAEEMSDWVEYSNRVGGSRWPELRRSNGHDEPHSVRFWSIGNENYGDWEIGAKAPEEWARFVAESAKMMKRADPTISLLAAAVDDLEWNIPLLREAGRYLDYISIHGYWDALADVNAPSSYLECMARTLEPENSIRRVEAMIRATGNEGVSIAFDEWNLRGWHHPWTTEPGFVEARDLNDDNSTYTVADAVFSAVFLNTCLRHADTVTMANLAPTVNARGPLFVHPEGIVRRSTFHVMSMYGTMLGSHVLAASVSSPSLEIGDTRVPQVDVVATGTPGSNEIVLAMINTSDTEAASCSITIDRTPIDGSFPATVLTGDDVDSFNDIGHPDSVAPVSATLEFRAGSVVLPPHSITFCSVAGSGARIQGRE